MAGDTHISNNVCGKSTASTTFLVYDVVRVLCHDVRVEVLLVSSLVRSFLCECLTQLMEEMNPFLLRLRFGQPLPCLTRTSTRPVHKHIDEHLDSVGFCGQEVEKGPKVDSELAVIASDDLADDIDANVRTSVVSSVN